MSSALLKFHEAGPGLVDNAILAAAVDESPHPLAITENGNVIYQNRSFVHATGEGPEIDQQFWLADHRIRRCRPKILAQHDSR